VKDWGTLISVSINPKLGGNRLYFKEICVHDHDRRLLMDDETRSCVDYI
jgi:hypothetical protein